jgi:aminopeptidase S
VDRIVVKHAGAGGENPVLNTKAFWLDVATSPLQPQIRVATVTANTANVTSHPVGLTGVTAVYLTINTPTQGTNQATRIYEVEVWGTASTCLLPGQKLINSGFEYGQLPWVAPLGVIGVHGVAYTGSWSARLSGDNWQTPSLSQTVLLPVGCRLMLGYRLKVDSDELDSNNVRDRLTVQVNSTTVATYSNANESSGWLSGWIDVSAFAGLTVTVRFTATGDLSSPTRFFLDDVGLWAE